MNLIDRSGTFRGTLVEYGVSETKNGYPQFVCRLRATEHYDETTGEYEPWAEYDQEIDAYLVLYTTDRKTGAWVELLNAQQIKKALGWDGASFSSLASGDYNDKTILFRVEEDTFNGDIRLKVTWIDAADAHPTRQLPKFNVTKLKALNEKFAGVMSSSKAPTPAKAPARPTTAVTKPASASQPTVPAVPPKGKPSRPTRTAAPPPVADGEPAPASKTTESAPTPSPSPKLEKPITTMEEAWAAVNQNLLKAVDDDVLANEWLAATAAVGDDESRFTPADWVAVANTVIDKTSKF